MKKQEVLELVEGLPEEVDAEELMYRLYVKAKLERAEESLARGETISHDEVVSQSRQWFK